MNSWCDEFIIYRHELEWVGQTLAKPNFSLVLTYLSLGTLTLLPFYTYDNIKTNIKVSGHLFVIFSPIPLSISSLTQHGFVTIVCHACKWFPTQICESHPSALLCAFIQIPLSLRLYPWTPDLSLKLTLISPISGFLCFTHILLTYKMVESHVMKVETFFYS